VPSKSITEGHQPFQPERSLGNDYWNSKDSSGESFHRQNQKNWGDFCDFVNGMFNRSKKEASRKSTEKVETWDMGKGEPLFLSQYADLKGRHPSDSELQIEWAHYVLQTNTKMTWDQILRKARLLSSRFHPDRNKETRAESVFKSVFSAKDTLEKAMKR